MNPFQVPQRGPCGESCPCPEPSFICLSNSSIKRLVKNLALLSKALGKGRTKMIPKTWPLWKQTPISKVVLSISYGVPSKGTLPLIPPHRAPTQRDALFPEPNIQFSKSLVNELPYRFPSRTRMKRDARFQSLPLHILQGPQ